MLYRKQRERKAYVPRGPAKDNEKKNVKNVPMQLESLKYRVPPVKP